jgi:hypothetical protein
MALLHPYEQALMLIRQAGREGIRADEVAWMSSYLPRKLSGEAAERWTKDVIKDLSKKDQIQFVIRHDSSFRPIHPYEDLPSTNMIIALRSP